MFGIFNRSHYEEVLWPVVHKKLTHKQTKAYLNEINEFESSLTDNGVTILKFFLHISEEEQTRRLQARIDAPHKHWKLSPADFAERKFWPQYELAYNEAISATSHKHAPGSSSPPTTSGSATSPSRRSSSTPSTAWTSATQRPSWTPPR